MAVVQIEEITAPVSNCDVVAKIQAKTDVRTYGANQSYISSDLLDDSGYIKMTLFGQQLVEMVEKIAVSVSVSYKKSVL